MIKDESGVLVDYTDIFNYSKKCWKINFNGKILFVPKSNVINKNSVTKRIQVRTWYYNEVLSKLLNL